jgi:hypothetical protein
VLETDGPNDVDQIGRTLFSAKLWVLELGLSNRVAIAKEKRHGKFLVTKDEHWRQILRKVEKSIHCLCQ